MQYLRLCSVVYVQNFGRGMSLAGCAITDITALAYTNVFCIIFLQSSHCHYVEAYDSRNIVTLVHAFRSHITGLWIRSHLRLVQLKPESQLPVRASIDSVRISYCILHWQYWHHISYALPTYGCYIMVM